MILSANQPYFAPFAGFFHKAILADVFVLLDEVQFPRGTTWMNRNRFKNDQGTLWMTIPVLIYPQLWGSFIPDLSAFDLVFNCGPKARAILTAAKETIP